LKVTGPKLTWTFHTTHPSEALLWEPNQPDQRKKDRMKNNTESKKAATPKASKAKREPAAKQANVEAPKPAKKSKQESEPVDRLPSNIDELKASKSGLVAYLFLSGKDKEAIAEELKTAFKLPDAQAVKIVRRITGRARFFQRVNELMAAK
jgi:hypothetical protein